MIWSRAQARLVPIEKLHAPTVAVMAIMTFAMMVVAVAGLALANSAGLVASGVENRYVIELPAAAKGEVGRAAAEVRTVPGVRDVTPVPESDLPVPALVTLKLAPGTDPAVIAARLRAAVPSARFIAETAELKPLLRSIQALQWLAVSLVLLMAAATAAAIVLAARGALDTHRPTIEIMHGIGATDAQLTRLFERKIGFDAIAGAAAGAAAAAAVLLFVGGTGAAFAGELTTSTPLGSDDLLLIALIPFTAVGLAVAVAHWTLLRALRATL